MLRGLFQKYLRFAALCRGDTPADVMESLIKELPSPPLVTFSKALTSIWRTRSRETANSSASSTSVICSSASL
jgi:hypothetical protein